RPRCAQDKPAHCLAGAGIGEIGRREGQAPSHTQDASSLGSEGMPRCRQGAAIVTVHVKPAAPQKMDDVVRVQRTLAVILRRDDPRGWVEKLTLFTPGFQAGVARAVAADDADLDVRHRAGVILAGPHDEGAGDRGAFWHRPGGPSVFTYLAEARQLQKHA